MDWFNHLFNKKERKRIFLDYASSTPVIKEVGEAMVKYFTREFANPGAIYEEGVKVREEVEAARTHVARILGAASEGVIFTSGATEANNLAILGIFEEAKKDLGAPHIIISATEHPSVEEAAEEAKRRGATLSIIPVDEEGIISLESLKKLIGPNTVLVSVSLANSEIGTVQPISKIGRLVKEARRARGGPYPLLHTDASAAPLYLKVALEDLQADLITLDGPKIYGPKGSGALVMRRGLKLHPLIFGGAQERGLRVGTEHPANMIGLAKALEIAERDRERETKRLELLRQHFLEKVLKNLPQVVINGSAENRLPNILSISILGVLGEFLALKLDHVGVSVSIGTACSRDERVSGSPVLRAIGKPELAESTIRLSFGRQTTEKELNEALKIFCREVENVLKSPHVPTV